MFYLLFLLVTLAILFFAFYHWQFYMVFTPTHYKNRKLNAKSRILEIVVEDNIRLEGVIYEPERPVATILLFVGRSQDAVALMDKFSSYYPLCRIVSFNYRGYGESSGEVNEKNMLSDALEIARLVEKNYGAFYLFGYSLGSNVAAYVAQERAARGLFLVGAFDSLASLAKSRFVQRGFFPDIDLSSIFRYRLATGEYVQNILTPTYLFVSRSDDVTYIENARILKEKIRNLVEYVELEGLNHKELLWDSGVTDKINRVIADENTL